MSHWTNSTGLDFELNLKDYLGFIYKITLDDGRWYIGRKQFWTARKKETPWRNYNSTSNTIKNALQKSETSVVAREIIAVFTSKSCMRFAEAAAIIMSGSYYPNRLGLNWSFDACKGTLKMERTDSQQMKRLIERFTK